MQLPENHREKFMNLAVAFLQLKERAKGKKLTQEQVATIGGVSKSDFSNALSQKSGRGLPEAAFWKVVDFYSEYNLRYYYAEYIKDPSDNPFDYRRGDDSNKTIKEIQQVVKQLCEKVGVDLPDNWR